MSKHTARKDRWTQLNAKEYRAAFAVVCYRAGAWEATVHFERRQPDAAEAIDTAWRAESAPAGRFKRPRNAMIAAEEKARLLLRRNPTEVRIAFED